MPKLHILSGVLEGKTFELVEERVTVGRALDNIIRIVDGTVSHHHATITIDGSHYELRDHNSTNGTRVNGLRTVETKLNHGDLVRFGSVELRFEGDPQPTSQTLPPVKAGVDLSQVGVTGVVPASFVSLSPFRREKKTKFDTFNWVLIGLGGLAVLSLSFFLLRLF